MFQAISAGSFKFQSFVTPVLPQPNSLILSDLEIPIIVEDATYMEIPETLFAIVFQHSRSNKAQLQAVNHVKLRDSDRL
jgi:hypothetical protein